MNTLLVFWRDSDMMSNIMILKGMKNARNFLESTTVVFWRLVLIPVLMVCRVAVPAWGQIKGYDSDFSSPAVLIDIDSDSGLGSIPPEYASCASSPPNTVFSVDFTSGLAYKDNTLYGLEREGGSGPIFYTPCRHRVVPLAHG